MDPIAVRPGWEITAGYITRYGVARRVAHGVAVYIWTVGETERVWGWEARSSSRDTITRISLSRYGTPDQAMAAADKYLDNRVKR